MVQGLHQIVDLSGPNSAPEGRSPAWSDLRKSRVVRRLRVERRKAADSGIAVALRSGEEVSPMRKLFVLALTAVLAVGVASLATAAAPPKSHSMLGEVVSVDAASHTFTIK